MNSEIERRYAVIERTDGDTGGTWRGTVTFFAPFGASEETLQTLAFDKAKAEISMVPSGGGISVRVISIEPL